MTENGGLSYTGKIELFRPLGERVEHALHGADGPWMAQKTQARGSMGHGSTIRAPDGVQLGRHVVEPGPLGASPRGWTKKSVRDARSGGAAAARASRIWR